MKHKSRLFMLMLLFHYVASAQTTFTDTITGNEVIISANKVQENKKSVSQQVLLIQSNEIQNLNAQTTGDVLSNTGVITLQKSQQGGGSPVLRGFEASRVLLVVDGVRMNNLIYRAGHLQNILTIDNSILNRMEVVMGPSSTIYGSDALGGVVHMYTKTPMLSYSDKLNLKVNAFTRFGTANKEVTGHLDFNLGGKRLASLTSVTYSSFDDLKGGENQNPFYTSSYGERPYYVNRIDDHDSIVESDDRYVQTQSGYTQIDILEKILFKQSAIISHGLNIQYSNSSDIPRYDRLTDIRNGELRYAKWYYGPQERLMGAYNLLLEKESCFFRRINTTLSYQAIEESRHQRSLNSNALQSRTEKVNVMALTSDFLHVGKQHTLRTGIDIQHNTLKSTAVEKDILTGEEDSLDTRYPGGDNTMTNAALYISHSWQINPQVILNDGIRVGQSMLHAEFTDKTFFPFPFTEVDQEHFVYSGNIGLVHLPTDKLKLSLSISTGFRSPNIDDMAKVFESSSGMIMVPNPDLKPEQTINTELGITAYGRNSQWENYIYFTDIKDAILTDEFTYNGEDSIEYNGALSSVFASQNKGKAYIYGFNSIFSTSADEHLRFKTAISYTYGRVKTDSTDQPLDHIPPFTAKTGLDYNYNRFHSEFFINFNGWKKLKDYSGSGEDNLQYATPDGMPAWFTINLHAGYQITKWLAVNAGIDNIFDTQYRVFASGINASGRNIFGTLRFTY